MSIRLKQIAQDGATDFQVPGWNNANGAWEPRNPVAPTQASATTTSGHTGASDSLVNGMTITLGAGDYKVEFSTSVEVLSNNGAGEFSIYVNGVQVAHTVRHVSRAGGSTSGTQTPLATNAYVTGVLAAQAIEVRAQISSGTLNIFERTMIVTRVG